MPNATKWGDMDLRHNIRAVRGDQSYEEFAAGLGCAVTTVYRWERGDSVPRSRAHVRQLIELGVDAQLLHAARVAAGLQQVAS